MSDVVVEARQLTKRYNDHLAVNGLNLQIGRGICYGLLGPNGAGKSTTMKMIYGSCQLTGGDLRVLGFNTVTEMEEIKARIGVVPQEDGLDPDFSVLDNLLIFSKYHRIPSKIARSKSVDLLQMLQLSGYESRHVETLSGGMKRRLAIARALLNDPEFLILDEPTTGLDPQARRWVWNFILDLKKSGVTVLLSTHYMDEAEKLCDFITIVDKGKILDEGKPEILIEKHIGKEVIEFEVSDDDVNYYVNKIERQKLQYRRYRSYFQIYIPEGINGRDLIEQITTPAFSMRRATLDDVFLKLSGHELRDG